MIRQSGVALVGIDDFNRLIGMATEDCAIMKEVGVMHRGRAVGGSQDKTVLGINGRMLFKPEVRHVVFDGSVAFQITRKLQRLTIFRFIRLKRTWIDEAHRS